MTPQQFFNSYCIERQADSPSTDLRKPHFDSSYGSRDILFLMKSTHLFILQLSNQKMVSVELIIYNRSCRNSCVVWRTLLHTERFIALYMKFPRVIGYNCITSPAGRFENMFYAIPFKLDGHVYIYVMLIGVYWSTVLSGREQHCVGKLQ